MDDFRGNEVDNSQYQNMVQQMKKLYPDREMQLVPPTHPIFHIFYDVDSHTMLPPYRMFNSGDPQYFGISDKKGNLQVMIDFNNDISEYWQALDVGACSIMKRNRSSVRRQLRHLRVDALSTYQREKTGFGSHYSGGARPPAISDWSEPTPEFVLPVGLHESRVVDCTGQTIIPTGRHGNTTIPSPMNF
jgi:hypothetical protein